MRIKISLPWLLVTIGISFNIVSALITSSAISSNNKKMHLIDNQISNINIRIDNYWQTRQNLERKKEFILLLLQNSQRMQLDADLHAYVLAFVNEIIVSHQIKLLETGEATEITLLSVNVVVPALEAARSAMLDQIDDAYLEKIDLEKQKRPLNDKNSWLMSIALFLQLFGLILVLAKDLSRPQGSRL
ncbi:MAG: hypothetical protein JKY93_07925 [Gammaproteobacteria bacterium]|nr:hypothetical protein [Gammaproteobacteria bacterium]